VRPAQQVAGRTTFRRADNPEHPPKAQPMENAEPESQLVKQEEP
jgi:hypothetical protein